MSALSFFQPAYLWALGFLSVILFLHFFRRRVVKRMDISTLRFFPAAAVSKSRVKKLMDFLLLLARLLLAAALILVFAGLHDKESPLVTLNDPKTVVYTWIDPAVSMDFAEVGRSAGQRAMDVVDSLVRILPPSVEHYYFDRERGRFLLSADNEAQSFASRHGPADLEEAVDAFIAASASEPSAVFVVLSDFKRSTAESFDSLLTRLIDNRKKVICVSFTPSKPYNYAVRARTGSAVKNEISAVVYASGAALDTTFVELTIGDLRIGQRSVAVPKDDSVLVTFDIPPIKAGSWGKVELHAADPLPFDNADYFTISADQNRSALIIGNTQRNRVIEAALRAAAPAFWNPVVRNDGGSLSYEDLNSADLVIINGFGGRSRILESFISGAGSDKGIIIALDPERDDDFGRAFLQSGGLSRAVPGVNTLERGTNPVLTDTTLALWRGFPAMSSVNARVYRFMHPVPGDPLARLGNARTLASSVGQSGAGLVIISTPIGITQANNLCETGFFVPFIDRLSRYALAGRGQAEEILYAGYAARNPFFGVGRTGTLYDPDGRLVASWTNQ
ncbi:MAG: BatA domain-containing protein, partial [Chitinispirillales bacterium]|nr:BatA domain-containing protein [Chitinispirillales bacterium]